MYKITIEKIKQNKAFSLGGYGYVTNPTEIIYTQVVENLDVAELICDVMNNSEHGADGTVFTGYNEDDSDEFGHEHGCPLSPASEFPFSNPIKGFSY